MFYIIQPFITSDNPKLTYTANILKKDRFCKQMILSTVSSSSIVILKTTAPFSTHFPYPETDSFAAVPLYSLFAYLSHGSASLVFGHLACKHISLQDQ